MPWKQSRTPPPRAKLTIRTISCECAPSEGYHNSPTLRISVKNRLFFSKQAHFVFGKLSEVANSEATKKLMQELPQNYKEIKSRINFDFAGVSL